MALDREDIETLENHEVRISALERQMINNSSFGRWLVAILVSAVAAFAGALAEVALRH
jgi:hypothetical protein